MGCIFHFWRYSVFYVTDFCGIVAGGISVLSFAVLFFVSGSLLTLGIVFFCLIVANAAKAKGDNPDCAGVFRQK